MVSGCENIFNMLLARRVYYTVEGENGRIHNFELSRSHFPFQGASFVLESQLWYSRRRSGGSLLVVRLDRQLSTVMDYRKLPLVSQADVSVV